MPEICRFYGIVIRMFFADHVPPHFHAEYGEHEARIAIDSLAVLSGRLPPRAMGLVDRLPLPAHGAAPPWTRPCRRGRARLPRHRSRSRLLGLEVKGGVEIGRDEDGWYSGRQVGANHLFVLASAVVGTASGHGLGRAAAGVQRPAASDATGSRPSSDEGDGRGLASGRQPRPRIKSSGAQQAALVEHLEAVTGTVIADAFGAAAR
jgi:hypothetical protein